MGKVSTINSLQSNFALSEMLVIWIGEFIKYCNPLHKLDIDLVGLA
jgi:hypothetical protein